MKTFNFPALRRFFLFFSILLFLKIFELFWPPPRLKATPNWTRRRIAFRFIDLLRQKQFKGKTAVPTFRQGGFSLRWRFAIAAKNPFIFLSFFCGQEKRHKGLALCAQSYPLWTPAKAGLGYLQGQDSGFFGRLASLPPAAVAACSERRSSIYYKSPLEKENINNIPVLVSILQKTLSNLTVEAGLKVVRI